MIEGNRIIAGYGTLAVDSYHNSHKLIIKHIQPPKEIGSSIVDEFEEIQAISIMINFNGYFELKRLLDEVSAEQPIFTFESWIFDFSQFNEKSVEVFKKGLNNVFDTRPLAC